MGKGTKRASIQQRDVPNPARFEGLHEVREGAELLVLEMEARGVRAPEVRSRNVPRRRPGQEDGLHRRLTRPEPNGVPAVPFISGYHSQHPSNVLTNLRKIIDSVLV